MQNYKDKNNKVHVLESTDFEHILTSEGVKITQKQADALSKPPTKTSAEINLEKDAIVEAELGGNNFRILVETFLQIIQDGSVDAITPDDVIALAKSKRRSEL